MRSIEGRSKRAPAPVFITVRRIRAKVEIACIEAGDARALKRSPSLEAVRHALTELQTTPEDPKRRAAAPLPPPA